MSETMIGLGITIALFFLGSVNAIVGWFLKSWMDTVKGDVRAMRDVITHIDKQLAVLIERTDRHERDIKLLYKRLESHEGKGTN